MATNPFNPLLSEAEKIKSSKNGGDILQNIYAKYPALKSLGEVTLKADPEFTIQKTGIGDIEYFSPEQDSVRYENYTVAHPQNGTHGIIYNPQSNDEEDIMLDMLHGMKGADTTYAKIRGSFMNQALKDRGGDIQHWYNVDKNEGRAEDGFDAWLNNYIDGLVRSEISEKETGDYAEERKYNSAEMKKIAGQLKKYLQGK